MNIIDAVQSMIGRMRRAARESDARSMGEFLGRCERFRLLLAANHVALEGMSDMGDALGGSRPVDMNFVRARCVGTVAAVGRMVEALCAMAPGRYEALREPLRSIALDMDQAIHTRAPETADGPLVLPLHKVAGRPDLAGGKAATLAGMGKGLGLAIPGGFVFTADAFRLFMGQGLREEVERQCMAVKTGDLAGLMALSTRIADLVLTTPLPQELEDQLWMHVTPRSSVRYAVRSSALDEDQSGASFAGQYQSVLNIPPDGIADAFREVVASLYSVAAVSYRRNRGLRDDEAVMCVACVEMVDADAGGVMYTRDPLGGEAGHVQIHAVPGLPAAIVDGVCDPDVWTVATDPPRIVGREVADKRRVSRCLAGEGTRVGELAEAQRSLPSVGDEVLLELARQGRRIEEYFGCPQDVEWAMAGSRLVFLQSRALEVQYADDAHSEAARGAVARGGATASPGVAAGPVYVVRNSLDLIGMPRGAVLVTDQAHPAWAAALADVAAVVAAHGSTAGHLANVAREFGIPALFGLPDAVKTLGGLAEVTVDATAHAVHEGVREDLVDARPARPPLMENSPVMRTLRVVADMIIPLYLTDPASPGFRPENCATLHDITRFCHEKGVHEMFGGQSPLPTGAARRLVTDVPTQYWVLDMGGGLEPGGRGAVSIDSVRSGPMLALWRGMTAVPWKGPPAAGGGGFLSVVMEATANPALAPGAANDMGERNYFIIGRDYCNLQSRFGFHFSTVEGHAGPFADENYAYIQFKGGGADAVRRRRRAEVVQNVLAKHGFLATARDDAVFARLENADAQGVLRAMAVLGHIIVHTRQMDMALGDGVAANAFQDRMLGELEAMLASDADQAHGPAAGDAASGDAP